MPPAPPPPSSASQGDRPGVVWDEHPAPDELAQLDGQCFRPALDALAYADLLREPTSSICVLRTVSPGPPIGWIVCRRVADEAEILRLGVVPSFRRQGWGERLVEHAFSRFRTSGARNVFLEVRAGNAAARALYLRLGFRETGRRRSYYAVPPDDAVLMAREL